MCNVDFLEYSIFICSGYQLYGTFYGIAINIVMEGERIRNLANSG